MGKKNEPGEIHEILDFLTYEDVLPEEYIKKAEVELGETESRRKQSLKLLRELICESEYESLKDVDSQFLLMFLKPKKFDAPRAFKMLKNFRRNRNWINTLKSLSTLDPIKEVWKDNIAGLIPHRDKAGRAIIVTLLENWDPQKWSIDEMFAAAMAAASLALLHPMTQVNGYVLIYDVKNLNFSHVRRVTPKFAYLIVNSAQDCLPGRCKEMHIVNENAYFRFAYALLRPFLSEKLRKRIFFHGSDMNTLHKHVDPQILNSEFGGCQGPFNNSFTIRYSERVGDRLLSFLKIG